MQWRMGFEFRNRWTKSGLARLTVIVVACCGAWCLDGTYADETVPAYDRIEEDWELVVGEPDPETHAPQVINVISPQATLLGHYAVLELNHNTQPEYREGGLQLQLWARDDCWQQKSSSNSALLATPGETIRYTLAMTLNEGQLKFFVQDGTSSTWGSFGGSSFHVGTPTQLTSLSRYTPAVSTAKSRVAFAGHRVEKFTLKQVRYFKNGEVLRVDETSRQVHPAVAE